MTPTSDYVPLTSDYVPLTSDFLPRTQTCKEQLPHKLLLAYLLAYLRAYLLTYLLTQTCKEQRPHKLLHEWLAVNDYCDWMQHHFIELFTAEVPPEWRLA